jgi:beta-galactosidase GanA
MLLRMIETGFRLLVLLSLLSLPLAAQSSSDLPHIDRSGAHAALIVDGSPYLILGAQVNNSSAWPSTMPAVWPAMETLGVNTLEAPVYWEQMEPREGEFDFSMVDTLLSQARAHKVRLVLLWFATWKNGSPGYTPQWVKLDQKRFPLAIVADGKQSFSLSPFGEQSMAADKKAFSALMRHLKSADSQYTVLMVQVENEPGTWGNSRDHSALAEKLFSQAVPAVVLESMGKRGAKGNWTQVFGDDADAYFHAWAIARYINEVADAGKREYPLPLYVNAALRDPLEKGSAGSFESGAPVYDALPIWHAMAPAIDLIAPDIYMPEYEKYTAVLRQYALPWNPLFVPETGNSVPFARYFFASLGAGAFGWAPFGMDQTGYVNYPLGAARIDLETLAPFALNYKIAGPMQKELARLIQQDQVRGAAENPAKHSETLQFAPLDGKPSPWTATVSYGLPSFYTTQPPPGNEKPEGEALAAQLGPDEFLVTGVHCRVEFNRIAANGERNTQRMWLAVEEGQFENGVWKTSRIWNGDQTDYGLNFTNLPQVLHVRLATF